MKAKTVTQRTYVSLALKSASLCKRSQFLSQWFQQKCWVKSQDHPESITASKRRVIWPSRFMWLSRFRKPWGAPLNRKNSEQKENGFIKRIQADKTTATKNTYPDHIYIQDFIWKSIPNKIKKQKIYSYFQKTITQRKKLIYL